MTAAAVQPDFKHRTKAALADATLKVAIDRTTGTAEKKRSEMAGAVPATAGAVTT